ncbi:hypothetical protein [Algivirga pacifica]|uniref:Phasin family protein n=1 Tax=Algivirga pacifica TaxID=1162670 RepID=A0ABP9DE96_9BACT
METLIKKFIYTGVGLAAFTAEKVKEVIDAMIAEERISEEEGKKIVRELMSTTENKKMEVEEQLRLISDRLTKAFSRAESPADKEEMEMLKARIEILEQRLAESEAKEAAEKSE